MKRTHRAEEAGEHFVPALRDPDRHRRMIEHIEALWGGPTIDRLGCEACGFGFLNPMVGGDAKFYELAFEGNVGYPSRRWEFDRVAGALAPGAGGRLLEVGAGMGAFIDRLREWKLNYEAFAVDYDLGGVADMQAKGINAAVGSLHEGLEHGPFDVICMFHTIEHVADLDGWFAAISASLRPGGELFMSVPNQPWSAAQERRTGYIDDMPPTHVGQWTLAAFAAFADRHGLRLETHAVRREGLVGKAKTLGLYRVNGLAFQQHRLARRVNALNARRARRLAKAALGILAMPRMLAYGREFTSHTLLVRFTRIGPAPPPAPTPYS